MTVNVTEVLSADEWMPEQAADHVREAWHNAVESIIETGRRLIEAKARVGEGQWLKAIALMPFSDSTARKLMAIARHPDLQDQEHVTDLPASWGTLAVLAQLPEGEIHTRIEAGEITPELDRATAQQWANVYMAAEQETLNEWGRATDGLLTALSSFRSYAAPPRIPASHVSLQTACDWAGAVNDILQRRLKECDDGH